MPLSSYARDKLIDHLLHGAAFTPPAALYLSAHTADPGLTGASEASGGSYARQVASTAFAAALNGTKVSVAALEFDTMPAATITHVGLWDAPTGGNFLWGLPLSAAKTLGAGDALRLAAGNLTASLS